MGKKMRDNEFVNKKRKKVTICFLNCLKSCNFALKFINLKIRKI